MANKNIYVISTYNHASTVRVLSDCTKDLTLFKQCLESRAGKDITIHTKPLINEGAI